MSDLIERQAAIDALEKEKPTPFVNKDGSIDPFGAGRQNQWYRDGIAIMNLPSAQPENMCVNLDIQKIATHKSDFSDLDEFPSVQPQRWIPVSEALPEKPFGCLVTVMDTEPMTMEEFENLLPYFVGYDGEQWNDWEGYQCPFEVLAWMPLPEPWRGGQDE